MKYEPKEPSTWMPKEAFAEYLGDRNEGLLKFYDKAVEKKNPMTFDFNLFAILLLPGWLAYRRQWPTFLAFVGLISALPLVEGAMGFSIPNGAFIGMAVALGFMANGLLLSDANARYAKATEAERGELAGHARPSVVGAVVGVFAAIGLNIAGGLLAAIVFGW